MKIIEIIASLGSGGAETLITDLSIGLTAKGADVLVVVIDPFYGDVSEQSKIENLINQGIQVISLDRKPGGIRVKTFYKLHEIIKSFNPKIVHFHSFIAGFYLLPKIVCSRKINFFQTIHNTKDNLNSLNRCLQKYIMSVNSSLIYCSNEAFKSLSSIYGTGSVINNGVAVGNLKNKRDNLCEEFNIPKDNLMLLNVGRVVTQKNQSMLLEIVEVLNKKMYHGKLHLLICGANNAGEVYIDLLKKKQTMTFSNCVHFVGVRNDVTDLMYSSDIYISTSIHEGLPITGLEAMQVGVPIVLSPIPEHTKIFNNQHGVYFPENLSVEAYVSLLSDLNIDKHKENNIAERKKFNSKFSIENNVNMHYKLFSEIIY